MWFLSLISINTFTPQLYYCLEVLSSWLAVCSKQQLRFECVNYDTRKGQGLGDLPKSDFLGLKLAEENHILDAAHTYIAYKRD